MHNLFYKTLWTESHGNGENLAYSKVFIRIKEGGITKFIEQYRNRNLQMQERERK